MTARGRVLKALKEWNDGDGDTLIDCMEQAITAAVEEEREACAKIAEEAAQKSSWANIPLEFGEAAKTIAEWIRARASAYTHSAAPAEK